ncbi:hypothetical protein ACIBP6_04075 [Nonomuraea terrae]|uniref:hypothetical protein n=1 Tax=Nonomuraea terrae TaxID=2530383 RepID=UPI00379E8FB2
MRRLFPLGAVFLLAATVTAAPAADAATVDCRSIDDPVYHRVDPKTGDSVYTTSGRESENLEKVGGHTDGAEAFTVSTSGRGGGRPVFRLYDRVNDRHAWTLSRTDRAALMDAGYDNEGADFFAFTEPADCLVPVHTYTDDDGRRRLAASPRERAGLAADGWSDRGLAFYAKPAQVDPTFTFAVIPDTQNEVLNDPSRFVDRTEWLAANADDLDLRYVTHIGDVVNWDTPTHDQYVRADAATDVLEAARVPIPFSYSIGNHDTAAVKEGGSAAPGDVKANLRITDTFNRYFPTTRSTYLAGAYQPGKIDNSFHTFTAGGLEWMVLNLELWPRTEVVEWARTVVAEHPHHNVIVNTHSYLTASGAIKQDNGGYGANSPQYLFDRLISQYANIRFVFSGHEGTTAHRVDTGVHGNTIHSILNCYHDVSNPTRLVEVDTEAGTFKTWVYSSLTDELKNDGSGFTVTGVDWVR